MGFYVFDVTNEMLQTVVLIFALLYPLTRVLRVLQDFLGHLAPMAPQ